MQVSNIVNVKKPYEAQSMIDRATGSLPVELLPIIFQNIKTEVSHLALVCKYWLTIIDDEQFRKTMRPTNAFGSREWKEYIGVDAGKEPPLPRRAYGDMEKGNYFLTFIPEKVVITQDDKRVKEISLNSLEVIVQLVSTAIKGKKMAYIQDYWDAIKEKRTFERPHWVLISKKIIGLNKTFKNQHNLAKEENKNRPGAKILGLFETATSLIMEYARSGELNFICDSAKYGLPLVRLNEHINGTRISLRLESSRLLVEIDCDNPYVNSGVVPAWKSFGHKNN